MRLQRHHRRDRRRLRHPPREHESNPVLLFVPLDELPRQRRTRADDGAQARNIVLLVFEKTVQPHPERRDSSGERRALRLDHVRDIGRLQISSAEHDLRAHHHGGVRNAPAVGVEHRDQLQDRVALAQCEHIGQAQRKTVQHQRPMRVQNSLGMTRGPRRVAGRRGGRSRQDPATYTARPATPRASASYSLSSSIATIFSTHPISAANRIEQIQQRRIRRKSRDRPRD